MVTCRTAYWAIDPFAPFKSPGVDGIFPALLQKARDVTPYLVRIFGASPGEWLFQPYVERLR